MTTIDISYWQHNPDFARVHAAGVSRVIMKCGGGEGGRLYQDSVYAGNRAAARAQGLAIGSYFFNGPVDPIAAADFQLGIIDWRPGDIVAIDVESNGYQPWWTPGQVLAWCQRILSHGVPAGRILVYMSSSILTAGWGAVAALGVGLWVAQYGPNDGQAHSVPRSAPWPSWALWQYTSAATYPGISGPVDTSLVAPDWSSLTITPIIPTVSEGDDTMRVIQSDTTSATHPELHGALALITESSGVTEYTMDTLSIGLAHAKVVNPGGALIVVSPEEYIVIRDAANARKTVSTVTNISQSTDNTALLAAIVKLDAQIAALPAPSVVDLSSLTASIANLPAADAAAVIAALKAKL